jgi:hypothetical protein
MGFTTAGPHFIKKLLDVAGSSSLLKNSILTPWNFLVKKKVVTYVKEILLTS